MSLAVTIHDGCKSLFSLYLLCIILIVYLSIRHCCPAHVIYFYIHHAFFLEERNFIANIRNLVGFHVRFYHFLHPIPKILYNCLANLLWMVFLNDRFALFLMVFALF